MASTSHRETVKFYPTSSYNDYPCAGSIAQLATTSPQVLPASGLATAWGFSPFPMIWADYGQQKLVFEDTIVSFNGYRMKYLLAGDSLEMYVPVSWSDSGYEDEPEYIGGYSFILAQRDTDSIVLRPFQSTHFLPMAHGHEEDYLFDTTTMLTLYNPFRLVDTSMSFSRLLNHFQGIANGDYEFSYINGIKSILVNVSTNKKENNEKWVMIDSTKHLYFYGSKIATMMTSFAKYNDEHFMKPGYYQGVLDDTLYQSMIYHMKFFHLDRLHIKKESSASSTMTFEVYYNNTYKYVEGNFASVFWHLISDEIDDILQAVPLTKSTTAQKIIDNFHKSQRK